MPRDAQSGSGESGLASLETHEFTIDEQPRIFPNALCIIVGVVKKIMALVTFRTVDTTSETFWRK